ALDAPHGGFRVFTIGDHFAHAGHGTHYFLEGAHFLELIELLPKVVEREVALLKLLLLLFQLFAAQVLLNPAYLLNQANQVALPENPLSHALGPKFFEAIEFFANADELDWYARHFLDREGSTATGVAIHLGQDDTIEFESIVECLRTVNGVLTGHGV